MDANPFRKNQSTVHRDWEEALTDFLVAQAKNPQLENWVLFSVDPEAQQAAAYSALVLHGMLEGKADFKKSANEAYVAYKTLAPESGAEGFQSWLRTGWLNLARVESMVLAELRY
jgi:hypothetical protein